MHFKPMHFAAFYTNSVGQSEQFGCRYLFVTFQTVYSSADKKYILHFLLLFAGCLFARYQGRVYFIIKSC